MERLPGGDERAVRPREEDAAGRGAGRTASSTASDAVYLLPVNLYGPGDNFDLETSHVIPALIRKWPTRSDRGEREIVLLGRRLADARVPLRRGRRRGHPLAAAAVRRADPVNLGTGVEISIRDLAALIAELTGFDGDIVWDTTKPNGQPRRQLDVSRAEELFGFRAHTSFREGLEQTIAWYRSHQRGGNRRDVTSVAYDAGRRAWETLPRVRAWLENVRPVALLAPAIAVQWLDDARPRARRPPQRLALLPGRRSALVLRQRLAARPRNAAATASSDGWPAFLDSRSPDRRPDARAGAARDRAVQRPRARAGRAPLHLRDRASGSAAACSRTGRRLCWIVVPFIGIKYTDLGYHQCYTEVTLPQSYGLTAMADFPSMVGVLVAVYFTFRVLDRTDWIDAVAAGLAAGMAIAIKPSNSRLSPRPDPCARVATAVSRRRVHGSRPRARTRHARTLEVPQPRIPPALQLGGDAAARRSARAAGSSRSTRSITTCQFNWHQLNNNLLGDQGALLEHARGRVARPRRAHRARASGRSPPRSWSAAGSAPSS